jgi:hypothetical protein
MRKMSDFPEQVQADLKLYAKKLSAMLLLQESMMFELNEQHDKLIDAGYSLQEIHREANRTAKQFNSYRAMLKRMITSEDDIAQDWIQIKNFFDNFYKK